MHVVTEAVSIVEGVLPLPRSRVHMLCATEGVHDGNCERLRHSTTEYAELAEDGVQLVLGYVS